MVVPFLAQWLPWFLVTGRSSPSTWSDHAVPGARVVYLLRELAAATIVVREPDGAAPSSRARQPYLPFVSGTWSRRSA